MYQEAIITLVIYRKNLGSAWLNGELWATGHAQTRETTNQAALQLVRKNPAFKWKQSLHLNLVMRFLFFRSSFGDAGRSLGLTMELANTYRQTVWSRRQAGHFSLPAMQITNVIMASWFVLFQHFFREYLFYCYLNIKLGWCKWISSFS